MQKYLLLLALISGSDARCASLADNVDKGKICRRYKLALPRPMIYESCMKGIEHAVKKQRRAKCEGYCKLMPLPRPTNENACKMGCSTLKDMITTCISQVAEEEAIEAARAEIIASEAAANDAPPAVEEAAAATTTTEKAAETTPPPTPLPTPPPTPVATKAAAVPVPEPEVPAVVEPISLTVEGFGSATVQPDQEPADVVEAFAQGVVNAGRAFELSSRQQLLDYFCARRPCVRTTLVEPTQPAAQAGAV